MKKIVSALGLASVSFSSVFANCGPEHGMGMMGAGMKCGMGVPSNHGVGGVALYLATLGLGYWLLRLAEQENKKVLKNVGRFVSVVILVVSLFGLLCRAGAGICRRSCDSKKAAMAHCPFPGSMGADAHEEGASESDGEATAPKN